MAALVVCSSVAGGRRHGPSGVDGGRRAACSVGPWAVGLLAVLHRHGLYCVLHQQRRLAGWVLAGRRAHQRCEPRRAGEGYRCRLFAFQGWCEVGKGQKTSTVTNPDILKDQVETMISKYFRGTLRSELHKEGSGGHISATFQPFQCLQLHIDDQRVSKVEEALANFFCEEHIDGLKNEKNNLNIKARRSYKLQLLPKVLVLHLKRFCFDPVRGQPVKLSQRITFPAQLRIPTSVMSHTLKSQSSNGAGPTYIYSLFSAVFHHGQHITSGHYTNFCRDDVGTWRYFDDQKVYDASIQDVLRFKDGSCYLLFYAIDGARSC